MNPQSKGMKQRHVLWSLVAAQALVVLAGLIIGNTLLIPSMQRDLLRARTNALADYLELYSRHEVRHLTRDSICKVQSDMKFPTGSP
jgi:hypothetical protein